jgi:hypothetical protein
VGVKISTQILGRHKCSGQSNILAEALCIVLQFGGKLPTMPEVSQN